MFLHKKITEVVHQLVKPHLFPGATAVDATCGNGHDACFLAEHIGTGRLYLFDVQKQALDTAASRIKGEAAVLPIHDGHENLAHYPFFPVHAAMFNLGYLPGGNKSITTTGKTTLKALESLLPRLAEGGIITLVAYPGHAQGNAERDLLHDYLEKLKPPYLSSTLHMLNRQNAPPVIYIIER